MTNTARVVVEDDWFTRLFEVVLDPNVSPERYAAFADFVAHDEPDFSGYCQRLREQVPGLYPARIKLVKTIEEMREQLPGARGLVVKSFPVGRRELEAGRDLVAVQKFASMPRNIDTQACTDHNVKVMTVKRRSSIACAEVAIALMLVLAKKMQRLLGRITVEQLAAEGYPFRPFDRRHTANSNWGRVPGIRTLNESTLGIIGIGEIGREIVLRLSAFGMRILYHQRSRLPEEEERALQVSYVPLEALLAESDWVIPQLRANPENRHFLDREKIWKMKPGAMLVNISRADLVDREALIDALRSGHIGGFALDPLYETPGRTDDELLSFPNVAMTPHIAAQPRQNALSDIATMILNLGRAIG